MTPGLRDEVWFSRDHALDKINLRIVSGEAKHLNPSYEDEKSSEP